MSLFPQKIRKNLSPLIILGALFLAGMVVFLPSKFLLPSLLFFLVLLFFIRFTEIGIYLITLLYPFIYLQLWLGQDINIPYVDLLAIFVFLAWGLKLFWGWLRKIEKFSLKPFPGFFFFLLFILVASLSLINVENLKLGIKYILRPLSFFYLMFVVLPYNVIKEKKNLFNVFRLLFLLGIFIALMGLWSFLFPPVKTVFRRAIPLPVFGIPILGTNHNLIAEALVAIIPASLVLVWQKKDLFLKHLFFLGVLLMILVTLLTFSRTGWITLSLELFILLLIRYRLFLRKVLNYLPLIILFLTPFFIYAYFFFQSPIVASANLNRLKLTKIAFDMWLDHPWIGSGVGTFIETVSRDRWYIIDYGEPLEAHGVIQKLFAEIGILGFLAFFLLLGVLFLKVIKTYRKIPQESFWKYTLLAMILMLLGSIVFQLFNTSYYVSKMWYPIGIALAASRIAQKEISSYEKD